MWSGMSRVQAPSLTPFKPEMCRTILLFELSPRTIRLARQYGRRPLDVMACPASALGMTHFLSSDRVIQFYEWPFPPFVEGARPTNPYSFEDYVARMNFGPRNLEVEF